MRRSVLYALALLSSLPAAAQQTETLGLLAVGSDLQAALEAEDERALAYVEGSLDTLFLRGSQGDPLLFWVPRCFASTFMPIDDIVPHIIAWAKAHADAPSPADLAANAVLMGTAQYCSEATGVEVRAPQ